MARPEQSGFTFRDEGDDPSSTGEFLRNGADIKFHDGTASRTLAKAQAVPDLVPATDDTYYLGENSSPFKAFKGLVLKDTSDGKHYRIQVTNGSVQAVALD
jgi:hypothetical protein